MLFWAEGSRERNVVKFTNSDPKMVAFFLNFLRQSFAIRDEKVAVTCNLFADHVVRQREIEDFWLAAWTVSIQSPQVDCEPLLEVQPEEAAEQASIRNLSLCVHDTRVTQHLYGAIQEYGGFEREEWLM